MKFEVRSWKWEVGSMSEKRVDCWIFGWLDGWMVGLLDGWMIGLLDCWIVGFSLSENLEYC